jgi:DNA-binding GntR family transcriptional regulator
MSEETYRVIKAGILTNKYPGGFQILEDDLARSLDMSRTPVREALLRLDMEGLIELIPRHGMRVRPLSLDDVREAYQLLGFMETAAAEMIASRVPNRDQVAALESHVRVMEASLKADDILGWAEADERFHRELVNLSGNSRLAKIANTLLDQTERFRRFTMRLRRKPTHFVSTHAELVREIRKGDINRIREVHLGHKARWLDEMAELVERLQIHQIRRAARSRRIRSSTRTAASSATPRRRIAYDHPRRCSSRPTRSSS